MYLCFDDDGRRMAFPEASLIAVDENGFTLRYLHNSRTADTTFVKMASFQGACQTFQQAMAFVKRTTKAKAPAPQQQRPPSNPQF